MLHGADDPVVPDDQTMAFWKEMRDAKANWEFVAYGKALHTFTNWLMPEDGPPPAAYNKQADRRSWIAMQNFFKEIFAVRLAGRTLKGRAAGKRTLLAFTMADTPFI